MTLVPAVFRIIRHPVAMLPRLVMQTAHFRLACVTAWFALVYRLVCCVMRRARGVDTWHHGALAGALAGLGLVVHPTPTLALYTAWKAVEVGCGVVCGAVGSSSVVCGALGCSGVVSLCI